MADEIHKLILSVQGRSDIEALRSAIQSEEAAILSATSAIKQLTAAGQGASQQVKRLEADMRASAATILHSQQQINRVQASTRGYGQAALQASYAVQDLTSMNGDLMRGFMAIQNNVPGIVMSLGGTAGLAGAIGSISLAISLALPHIIEFISSLRNTDGISKFRGEIELLQDRIKKLEAKPVKLAVDYHEIDEAKRRLDELQEAQRGFKAFGQLHSQAEQESGAAVKNVLEEAQGGRAHIENKVKARIIREMNAPHDAEMAQAEAASQAKIKHIEEELNKPGTDERMAYLTDKLESEKRAIEKKREEMVNRRAGIEKTAESKVGGMFTGATAGDQGKQQELADELRKAGLEGVAGLIEGQSVDQQKEARLHEKTVDEEAEKKAKTQVEDYNAMHQDEPQAVVHRHEKSGMPQFHLSPEAQRKKALDDAYKEHQRQAIDYNRAHPNDPPMKVWRDPKTGMSGTFIDKAGWHEDQHGATVRNTSDTPAHLRNKATTIVPGVESGLDVWAPNAQQVGAVATEEGLRMQREAAEAHAQGGARKPVAEASPPETAAPHVVPAAPAAGFAMPVVGAFPVAGGFPAAAAPHAPSHRTAHPVAGFQAFAPPTMPVPMPMPLMPMPMPMPTMREGFGPGMPLPVAPPPRRKLNPMERTYLKKRRLEERKNAKARRRELRQINRHIKEHPGERMMGPGREPFVPRGARANMHQPGPVLSPANESEAEQRKLHAEEIKETARLHDEDAADRRKAHAEEATEVARLHKDAETERRKVAQEKLKKAKEDDEARRKALAEKQAAILKGEGAEVGAAAANKASEEPIDFAKVDDEDLVHELAKRDSGTHQRLADKEKGRLDKARQQARRDEAKRKLDDAKRQSAERLAAARDRQKALMNDRKAKASARQVPAGPVDLSKVADEDLVHELAKQDTNKRRQLPGMRAPAAKPKQPAAAVQAAHGAAQAAAQGVKTTDTVLEATRNVTAAVARLQADQQRQDAQAKALLSASRQLLKPLPR